VARIADRGQAMLTVFADAHAEHAGLLDPLADRYVPSPECPERADGVLAELEQQGIAQCVETRPCDSSRFVAVHAPEYVEFLRTAWTDWVAAGETATNARPMTFVSGELRGLAERSIHGRLGKHSFDTSAPFVAGSWNAIRRSAETAVTAALQVAAGAPAAFALCRPPGHHASRDRCGGYCYLNNTAIAAQTLRDQGCSRIAILDVDYHHGNGTQSIFYARGDVLTVSLHADPRDEYPYFAGYADETGSGKGSGLNINYPLPLGTNWHDYSTALGDALARISTFVPDAIVVALGLDTYAGDPTTHFGLRLPDYRSMGRMIRALGVPVLTVLEGGYAVEAIGANTASYLRGIEDDTA